LGAHLLKFGGDALLLLFRGEQHALRAAAAAHAMRLKLREIGVFETTAGKVSLRMSVCIHSGQFDFFLVGGSHRELIVAGPAASRTVEMEAASIAGQILVSPETAAALPRRNRGREAGPGILLRGEIGGVAKMDFPAATSPSVDLAVFIPDALRETLLSGDVNPEHRPAAVAFLHYGNFDRLLEDQGGNRTAEVLDHLVRSVQEAVNPRLVTFLGTDIAGDGGKIILTSGVPMTAGNDEEQMLLSLRQIVSRAHPELPLQVGVNWGYVFSGEIGPPYRRTYTVMGDVVNLAARLMARAPTGHIYTTQGMFDGSRTTFSFTMPEPFYVKGKKLPIQAFSLGEPVGSKGYASAEGIPLVGRTGELSELLTAWESAKAGNGRVVEVSAEPGIGKSRLLQEFLARSAPERLVRAECRLYQASAPYFPFAALLRSVWGLEDLSDDATEAALGNLVDTSAPQLEPWLALIGLPLGLDLVQSPEVAQLEDQFRPARVLSSVASLLEATVTTPTLFAIEDTHWMDEASRELLAGLMIGLDRVPWLIALTRRPGDGGFVAPTAAWLTRILLQPLGLSDAKELILKATEGSPLLPQRIEMLAARAEGNPLFLIELLQALKRGGNVETLPHSVEGLIGARIDKLPSADRNLLRRLAILGAGFRLEHVPAVLREHELDHRWRTRAIPRLSDFVTMDSSGWIQFRHALIRDAAYEGLPFKTRLELHARVGDSICGASGGHPETQSELLSLHYFYARRWNDAWRYSRLAGDRAKAIYANAEAAQFYERAVTASRYVEGIVEGERAEVLTSLGDVLEAAGSFVDALLAYKRAIKQRKADHIAAAEIYLKRSRTFERQGNYRRALSDISVGYKLVDRNDEPAAARARARLIARRAGLRMAQQKDRQAIADALSAVAEAKAVGETAALAEAYGVLDISSTFLGLEKPFNYGKAALDLYELLGDITKQASVNTNLGIEAFFAGRWDEALERYERARSFYLRAGNEVQAAATEANISEILLNQGHASQAEELLRHALAIMRAAGLADEEAFAEAQFGRALMDRGDLEGAEKSLRAAVARFEELGEMQSFQEASAYLGTCLTSSGQPAEARSVIARAREAGEVTVNAPALLLVDAEALEQMGMLEDAFAAAVAAGTEAERQTSPYQEARAVLLRARLARLLGMRADDSESVRANDVLMSLGVSPRFIN
jgi:class 3 adenylate cyclase/tetratricopeptide (TPR) repeat protein